MNKLNCPVCGAKLNKAGHTVFCKCGWNKSFNNKQLMAMQKQIAKGLFIAGFGLMSTIIYIGNWGSHSFSIIPLKARQWTGQLNTQSFDRLKNICMELKKYNCVEKAHRSFFNSSDKLEVLEQLGEFQYRRKKINSASNSYNQYFTNKGRSVKAAYNYARVLEKQGHVDSALSYYKYALGVRPNTVQITVMRSYIDLLMKAGKRSKAKAELLKFKSILKRSGSLVQQEYDRWNKKVNG